MHINLFIRRALLSTAFPARLKTLLYIALFSSVVISCQNNKKSAYSKKAQDSLLSIKVIKSINVVKRADSIAQSEDAIQFPTPGYSGLSINLDTLLSKKILLHDFDLIGIQKKNNRLYAQLIAQQGHYLFSLSISPQNAAGLRKSENSLDTAHFLLIRVSNIYPANEEIIKNFAGTQKVIADSLGAEVHYESIFKMDGELIRIISRH